MPVPSTWARFLSSHLGYIPSLICFLIIPLTGMSFGASTAALDSLKLESSANSEAESTPSPLAWPAVAAISLYQKILSPQQGLVCAFQPTCSHFAQKALRKYGLLQGSLMTSDRLQRCHFCAAGRYPLTETGHSYDPAEGHLLWGDGQLCALPVVQLETPLLLGAEEEQEPLLSFANHLFTQGDYLRAHAQFLAFWRSSPYDPRAGWALLRAGICLQKIGRWPEAAEIFGNLSARKTNSSLGEEATFQMALARYQAGDFPGTWKALAALEGTSRGDRAALMTGWIHLGRGEWSLANSSVERVARSSRDEFSQAARLMAEKAGQGPLLPHRSPLLAATLSTILPGLGKWYAGKPMDGLYSLLLVGTTTAIACTYGCDQQGGKAGAFGAVDLFFYLGNIFGSAVEAKRFNRRVRETLLHNLESASRPATWLWNWGKFPDLAKANTSQEQSPNRAEKLFREGQYDTAITEYKRHLFLFPEDPDRDTFRYKIGLAYLNVGLWEEARDQLRSVSTSEAAEELSYRARLRWAQSYLNQDQPDQGRRSLSDLMSDPAVGRNEVRRTVVQYWLGVCALRQSQWVEAEGFFHGLEGRSSGTIYFHPAQHLSRAARQGFLLPRKSPSLAAALSLVLPGSGQIYCGRWWDGLFSMALNASVGYLTIDAFRDGRRLDGVLLVSLLWSRFYFGGQQNAARYAREYNRRVREEHLERYQELMTPVYGH